MGNVILYYQSGECMNILYESKEMPLTFHHDKRLGGIIHMHKEIELVYVKKGKAVAYADRNVCVINPGDLFFTFPNQIHYYDSVEDGDYFVTIFSPEVIFGNVSQIYESVPDINMLCSDSQKDFNEIFEKIANLKNDYYYVALNGYVNVIMSMILPFINLKKITARNNSSFYNIINYCTKNFTDDISLDSISKELHLSKYYISRLINEQLNQNFNDYINMLRVSEACNLLKETDCKISDISIDTGFGTIRSFNRAFKKLTGVSPAEYRQKVIKSKNELYM